MDARVVAPEWLDSLPADSAEAKRSRRDLCIIHGFMRTRHWLRQQLTSLPSAGRNSVAELGAGDGRIVSTLAADFADLHICGYDRIERPPAWPANWQWQAGDFTRQKGFDQVTLIALLILHHFENSELAALGQLIQAGHTQTLIAVEPARMQQAIYWLRAGRLLGFCPTTLHDGTISIQAGFRGDELPHLLGLKPSQWTWRCEFTRTGAYRMVAQRRL